jgi:hypothetical protein
MKLSDPKTEQLDAILTLQLVVAWAGETADEPQRLGWWRSDLIDEAGGGDFFRRLLPSTHKWAALEAARKVAECVDQKARQDLPNPDQIRTLFFWGFDTDERLGERLRQHKMSGRRPEEALELPLRLDSSWSRDAFQNYLQSLPKQADFVTKRQGRELPSPKDDNLAEAAAFLAGALLPLGDSYPAPYYRLKA